MHRSIARLLLLPRPLAAADLHPFDLPPGFVQEVLARDLGPATAFALRPDGSILIARKHGSVKVWRDGKVLEAPFLDLSGEVNRYADRGLMGIAVHPDFPRPAYVYLAYAYEPPAAPQAARWGARPCSGRRRCTTTNTSTPTFLPAAANRPNSCLSRTARTRSSNSASPPPGGERTLLAAPFVAPDR